MEKLTIMLDDGTGVAFDAALQAGMPSGGDMTVITKDDGTKSGRPVVLVTFSVKLPTGNIVMAQEVTTVRNFIMAAKSIEARYPDLMK